MKYYSHKAAIPVQKRIVCKDFFLAIVLSGLLVAEDILWLAFNHRKGVASALARDHMPKGYSPSEEVAFLKSIEKIPSMSKDMIRVAGERAYTEANSREHQDAQAYGSCIQSYRAPCTQERERIYSPKKKIYLCKATSLYKGPCQQEISFDAFTIEAKQNWSNSCLESWPCEENECRSGIRNYMATCPEGFLEQDDGECLPNPVEYTGICFGRVNFKGRGKQERIKWSQACGTTWPCEIECNEKLSHCPENWIDMGNFECKPGKAYLEASGTCTGTYNFRYYTKGMKQDFARNCGAPFRCEESCKTLYALGACPEGYTRTGDSCTPPARPGKIAFGSGGSSLPVVVIPQPTRKSQIEWSCAVDSCERNWDALCPQGWKPVLGEAYKSEFCTPIETVEVMQSQCSLPKITWTHDERRKWSSSCQSASWPCIKSGAVKINQLEESRPPFWGGSSVIYNRQGSVEYETGEILPKDSEENSASVRLPRAKPHVPAPANHVRGAEKHLKKRRKSQAQYESAEKDWNPSNLGRLGYYTGGHYLLGSSV